MAKKKQTKHKKSTHRKSTLSPLQRLALKPQLKRAMEQKHPELSPEEQEMLLNAMLNKMDLKTLLTDPEALAEVALDPGGSLRNYLIDPEDADIPVEEFARINGEDTESSDVSPAETTESEVSEDLEGA